MAELFGYTIKSNDTKKQDLESFAPEVKDDGAMVVQSGGVMGTYLDLEGAVKTEAELVTRYREMSLQPEVDYAIDDIVNEMIAYDAPDTLVKINLDNVDYSDSIKNKIKKEFDEIVRLLDFNNNAYDLCRRFYIDGRMYYHAIIDNKNPDEGIQELRYIDPRKIRKIRETVSKRVGNNQPSAADVLKTKREYYVYSDRGWAIKNTNTQGYQAATGIRVAADSVIQVTSGLMDKTNSMVLSYLHKAIKPLNQLRAMEDASVIYRLVRAPERRIFYIDVGSLPKAKAEQYLRDMMTKHKNKLVYDAQTGEIRDDRKFMTMLEDYWLPRREGGRGTEISTLPGGQNLGQMEDVEYFLNKLYKSLGVPTSRLQQDGGAFNMGRSSEITRDELKFSKFVDRLRMRFAILFKKALIKQLILKRVISEEESDIVEQNITFDFQHDNYFAELKETEIIRERMALLQDVDPFVGKYFSVEWVKRKILRQTEDEMKAMQLQMDKDAVSGEAPDQGIGGPEQGGEGDDQQQDQQQQNNGPQFKGQGQPGGPDGPRSGSQ